MKIYSLRIAAAVVIIAPLLAFYPPVASGATVTVTVAPSDHLQFSPASVAIQQGDTVQWTWNDDGHSSTSGSPGSPSGMWDSGVLNQGATFSHTFNTVGSFPYYCTPHGACCGMIGTVTVLTAADAVNVTQHHNHDSRDGLYIDPAFTQAAAANLTRDTSFNGTLVGNVYAQPLYIAGGPGGAAMIIAVTESNNVYALDAANGSIIWQRNVGTPVPLANLPCGDIDPLGITGTPIVDLASRSLFLDAMTTPDGGTTKKHLIFSLNVDTGVINSGWPVDVNAIAISGSTTFTSSVQNERGALAIVNNSVYVPYGGHAGDCGTYHGWLVGVPTNNPASVTAWATLAVGGGSWAVGGVSSDGDTPFIATGNTSGATVWSGGEAVIRFQSGPVFSGLTNDYWAPTNWQSLDNSDLDIGGSGALLVDVPGATPSNLVVSLGKDGNAYLLNRSNLGGVSNPVAQLPVSSSPIIQAAATYRTNLGTYVVFRASSSTLSAFRINPTNPPTITSAWSVSQSGHGSPFVTSTDGTNDMTAWVVGSEGDQRLHGYDGDTGNVVYAGGGANELMTGTRRFNTGIAARGRIYIANDNRVYAFAVPVPTLQLVSAVSRKTHGSAGDFDIPLPLTGEQGVECRSSGGNHRLVFTASNNLVSGNASVTTGIGSVLGSPTFTGNTMTVNLTGVTDVQKITVTLSNVTDIFSQVLPDTPVSVNMLIGDTTGNKTVNASDIAQTKRQSGQPVTAANFREDVNANGTISASDIAQVKANAGHTLP